MYKNSLIYPGPARFNKYIVLINECLTLCKKDKNPAKKLYQTKVRSYLFMLESLARIYKKIHSKKAMKLLQYEMKAMEDKLGKIDFYDGLNKQKPSKIFKTNYLKAIDELNTYLVTKKFLIENTFLIFCNSTLKNIEWLSVKKDTKKIKKVIEQELKQIIKHIKTDEGIFDEIESGIHELRRDLRWISIYAASLNGLLQLKKVEPTSEFKKYYISKVLNSPFNILPINTNKKIIPIQINSNNYYALSWIIMELGVIKDKGLMVIESGKPNKKIISSLLQEAKTKTTQFVTDFDTKNWFVN